MAPTPPAPRVSIIHAHPRKQPPLRIRKLGEQLRGDGVDASLDVWDLNVGQDIYAYIEEEITNENIQQVIVIIDAIFLEKTEQSQEVQLIRRLLYENTKQERIVPLIDLPKEQLRSLPPYLQSRFCLYYCDADAYEQLLKVIYKELRDVAPALGTRPTTLATSYFSATPYLRKLAQSKELDEESQHFMEDFQVAYQQAQTTQYPDLYQAWREWLEEVVKTRKNPRSIDTGILIESLEKLWQLTISKDQQSARSFLHQLFLTALIIGFEKRNFKFLGHLLQGSYYMGEQRLDCTAFNCYQAENTIVQKKVVEQINQEKAANIQGLLQKTTNKKTSVEADLMCYYICAMNGSFWMPFLAKQLDASNYPITWFKKLDMKKFFEKTKMLYGVENEAAFAKKVNRAYLQEQKRLPLLYKVRPLNETGLPRRVNVLD